MRRSERCTSGKAVRQEVSGHSLPGTNGYDWARTCRDLSSEPHAPQQPANRSEGVPSSGERAMLRQLELVERAQQHAPLRAILERREMGCYADDALRDDYSRCDGEQARLA